MKKTVIIILALILILTGVGIYVAVNAAKEDPVIICSELEVTEGLYALYVINEALLLDYKQYETQEAFLEDVQESVINRICIDAYYHKMCVDEGMRLTDDEALVADTVMLGKMIELGFEYTKQYDDNAYWEYFNVSRIDFQKFYRNKALFDKYLNSQINKYKELPKSQRELRRKYPNLYERAQAELLFNQYIQELRLLNSAMIEEFNNNRSDYAKVSADVAFLAYPKEEFTTEIKNKYRSTGISIKKSLENGTIIHNLKDEPKFAQYLTSAKLLAVDNSSNLMEIYGEKFVDLCINGNVNEVYMLEIETGVVIFRIYQILGADENRDRIELAVRTREIGNIVRKSVLDEEYEPIIVDEGKYSSIDVSTGLIWQKLLEK